MQPKTMLVVLALAAVFGGILVKAGHDSRMADNRMQAA